MIFTLQYEGIRWCHTLSDDVQAPPGKVLNWLKDSSQILRVGAYQNQLTVRRHVNMI